MKSTNIHFLTPLRSFTEGEYRAIQVKHLLSPVLLVRRLGSEPLGLLTSQNEHKLLVNKRLDLDVAKNRLRKAHDADREARVRWICVVDNN